MGRISRVFGFQRDVGPIFRRSPMSTGPTHSWLAMFLLILIVCSVVFNAQAVSAQEISPPATNSRMWNYDELKKAPEKVRLRRNPFENDAEASRAGGKLFERSCAECH